MLGQGDEDSQVPKVYQADCWLGVTTDTLDMSGAVLREREVAAADDEIRAAFEDVHGRFDQMPPMVSALKHQGKPLYEYARAGTEIERKARPVEIYSLEVEEIAREAARTRVAFTVGCSRGTYIRSLCDDIGERLGSGGAMGALRRLSAGRFRADEAVSLEELEELQSQGRPPLLTPAEALADLPSVRVVPAALRAVLNGQQLKPAMILGRMDLPPEGECLSVLDPDGELIAIHMTAQAPAYVTKTLRVL